MSAPNRIIEPIVSQSTDPFGFEDMLIRKVNEIVNRLNWLLDILPCHFSDGMCQIHNSPQVFTPANIDDGDFRPPMPSDYCGVAEVKMRTRVRENRNE